MAIKISFLSIARICRNKAASWKNQCSRAGASLNLQVRKRSKMRTNHPVLLYSMFYIVSCHCSESKQCVFTICVFFQKGILVSLVSAFFVSFQIFVSMRARKFKRTTRKEGVSSMYRDQSAHAKPG